MVIGLLLVAYCIGVAVDGFLYGLHADLTERWDRERAWLAALIWPLSMWAELGYNWRHNR